MVLRPGVQERAQGMRAEWHVMGGAWALAPELERRFNVTTTGGGGGGGGNCSQSF